MDDIVELKKACESFSVLYVEDEEKLGKSVFQYLSKFFKTVKWAFDGKKGLEIYTKEHFDIVITDIHMPCMNGLDMSTKIKEINPKQRIIIVSAYSDVNNFITSIKIGIDGYIIKPFKYPQINEVLFKVANIISSEQENELFKTKLLEMVKTKTDEVKYLEQEKTKNYKDALYTLVDLIEQRDAYTGGHSNRVAKYCKKIAQKLNMSEKEIDEIYEAGVLHDIGKIAIPDSVLLKPGKLSDLEYSLIKKHVNIGYKILVKSPMFERISKIVKLHHERLDGSGYPDGLKGEQISLSGSIMAVADSFDAMTTSRIYKAKRSVSEALDELKLLGGDLFDKKVVECALEVLKDIKIDSEANQLPKDDIEKQRFAYFYKDQFTQAYNKNYLDLILTKNRFSSFYKKAHVIFLKNFNFYNKLHSWEGGDELLKKIANMLVQNHSEDLIFRIQGDDFVVLSEKDSKNFDDVLQLCAKNSLECKSVTFDIKKENIKSFEDFKKLINL